MANAMAMAKKFLGRVRHSLPSAKAILWRSQCEIGHFGGECDDDGGFFAIAMRQYIGL
jgi:hypothetical protein